MSNPLHRYRTVFVSDVHLGAAGSKAEAFQSFLREVECEKLYLVGDIIDGWVGRRSSRWAQNHNNVVRALLGKSKHECPVFYTPGNHDAFMRSLNGHELGNIQIDHSFVHRMVDGRDLLVVHGDLFDLACTRYKPIAWLGAWAYEGLMVANQGVNLRRAARKKGPIDFCTALKKACKRVSRGGRLTTWEQALCEHAREEGFAGVVCGHVHRPMIQVQSDGFAYINTGDWVEHCTAVVEHHSGRLSLLWWDREAVAEFDLGVPADQGWVPTPVPAG